eukprot:Lithocolla_globosa_v1_NODE_4768_length_1370_cov_15.290494.p2 type:complete len:173 gc:universal NODE_4768_length_1370_cov_15.290494:783-1301(+)
MSGSKRIIDVNITKLGEACTEGFDFFCSRFEGLAVLSTFLERATFNMVLAFAFFFRMEAQVFQNNDGPLRWVGTCSFDLGTNTVSKMRHRFSKEFCEAISHRLECHFRHHVAVWPSKMAHQNHRLGTQVQSLLNGGERTYDALVVCNSTSLVLRNVEINANQDALSADVNVR